jgi:hypothetical protein
VFSARSVPKCYRQDRSRVQLVELESIKRVGGWCEMAASLGVSAVQASEQLVGKLVRTAVQPL